MIDLKSYAKEQGCPSVAVFGLGVSGLSSVKALIHAGFSVTAYDDKKESCEKAKNLGADIEDLSKKDLSGFHFLLLAPGVAYMFEPHSVVLNAQKYDVEIIGDIELLHRCGHGKKTIGITGTNGKSTTTALMAHVLKESGFKADMAGNIGVPVCDLDLNDIDYLVLELSSYQLDLCPSFRPDISVLLNITPDHIDRHGSMLNYIKAKEVILEGDGLAVVGVDDDYTRESFNTSFFNRARKMIPVSVKAEVTEGFFVKENALFQNHKGDNKKIMELDNFRTLKGLHNYQNMISVYAVSSFLGIDLETIKKAFNDFEGLAHRQYRVREKDNIVFINDSKATNAEAAAKALSSFNNIFWIVGGRAKEGGLNGLEIFKDKIKKTYVIGEAENEFSEWLSKYGFDFECCKILDVATQKSYEDAQKQSQDSVILLSPACASWDQFSSFEKRGDAFTEQVLKLTETA